MLDYGFNGKLLLVYIERQTLDDVEEDRLIIEQAYSDNRFRKAKTPMLVHYASRIHLEPGEIQKCAESFASGKPARMATVTHDPSSHEIMVQFTGMVRACGVDSMEFRSLATALHWINNGVAQKAISNLVLLKSR